MKRLIFFVILVLMAGVTGCATRSYYTINGTRLHIYLKKPEAREVYFASSIDAFALHPTRMKDNGTWESIISLDVEFRMTDNGIWETITPLNREFRYFFIVDGRIILPPCPYKEKDDFGTENCIFIPET